MSVKQLSSLVHSWYPGLLDRIWTSKPEYHLHIHAPADHEYQVMEWENVDEEEYFIYFIYLLSFI